MSRQSIITVFFIFFSVFSFADTKKSYKEFFEKDHRQESGMFILHLTGGKVYFEIPDSLLGRDMLLGSTIESTSDNNNGIVGSKPVDPLHIVFLKDGDKISLRSIRDVNISSFENDSDSYSISKYGAILDLFDIETLTEDSSAYVIELTDFLLGDQNYITPFDRFSNNVRKEVKRSETFSKDNSFIKDISAFEKSVSVTSNMSYKYSLSGNGVNDKDVPFTTSVVRSFMLLDKVPYRPRLTDSRIAIFPTEKVLFSDTLQGSRKVYFANRWRIEPSDIEAFKRGETVNPVKQIIFYIDSMFPKRYIPYIKEGVEQWNDLFEEIGFKNVMKATVFPSKSENPDFDPNNLTYSCIRYAPINIENAMGPSWIDPRSGEILTASVYLYHDVIKLLNSWLFIQTSQVDYRARRTIIEEEVIGDALRYVVSHEVGHCLGFMHNMSASANVPVDSLRSASYTRKYGTTTSIMDYARFNYVAQPQDSLKGLKLTPPRFGKYDSFLIKYNYSIIDESSSVSSEYSVLKQWLNEASFDPVLRFGKQQFYIQDPRSQTEDLGDDAIKASEYGIKNLKFILSHLEEWVAKDDPDYSYRKNIYSEIVSQYSRYLTHVYNNIGGINLYESYVGDGISSYTPVSAQYQRDALNFILDALDDLQWLDNTPLLAKLPISESYARILNDYLMSLIMKAPSRCELTSTFNSEPFTPEECMEMIYKKVWGNIQEKRPLTEVEMSRQISYLKYVSKGAGVEMSDKKGINEKAAYDEQGALYFENIILPGDHYSYLLKIEKALKKGAKNKDEKTAAHCINLLTRLKI